MSTVACTCLVPNCKFFRKIEFADSNFIISHYRRHSYNELRFTAIDNQIVTTSEMITKEWLVRELARVSAGVCYP